MHQIYPSSYICIQKNIKTKNPFFFTNVINIWYCVHQHIGDLPVLSPFSPIWGNNHILCFI